MRAGLGVVIVLAVALPALAQTAPTGTFDVAPGESRVEFFVRDNRGGFTGRSDQVTGTVTVRRRDDGTYAAEMDLRVPVRTIRTGIAIRDDQMRGSLRAREFPQITFRGTATAERVPEGAFEAPVRGTMTVAGRSREITLPATITRAGDAYRGEAKVTLRMTDFGITPPRLLFLAAEDPVDLTIRIVTRAR